VRNLGSPLFQAFFGTLLSGKALSYCIKDGKNIDPACKEGILFEAFFDYNGIFDHFDL